MNPISTLWHAAGDRAATTGPERNRYVDLLRAVSIMLVVLGHWLMASPKLSADGSLRAGHVLADVPWTQWLTWAFQVMPVFFMVGGYANRASWSSALRSGRGYGQWLNARLRRLIQPVVPLLVVWTLIALIALGQGVDPYLVQLGSRVALAPVWFLAVYLLVIAVTPVTAAMWERFGWWSFSVPLAAAVAVDAISIAIDSLPLGFVNYLFIWGALHQLGYAWRDGRMSGRSGPRWALIGFTSLIVLVSAVGYPISMVDVPGAVFNNTLPPRLPLVALGAMQIGIALSFETVSRRALQRLPLWTAVVMVNSTIMTIFLWHSTAMVAVVGVSLLAGGLGLHVAAGSLLWWVTRPLWLLVVGVVTVPLVLAFSRFERPRGDLPAPMAWRGVLAVGLICAGLGTLAHFGIGDETGVNWPALALPFVGAAVGGFLHMGRHPT